MAKKVKRFPKGNIREFRKEEEKRRIQKERRNKKKFKETLLEEYSDEKK